MRTIGSAFLLVASMASAGHAATAVPPLVLSFSQNAVTISAVTPGARVVLFGVSREPTSADPPVPQTVRRAEVLADSDNDGSVRYEIQRGVPHMGMWIAVDLTSGAYAAAPSPDYEPTQVAITPDLVKKDNNGQLKKLAWPFAEMEMLLVRPGSGAWCVYASKYSALDENAHTRDPLQVDIARMTPIGNAPAPPEHFRKGDVIAIFDPRWMQFGWLEVGE